MALETATLPSEAIEEDYAAMQLEDLATVKEEPITNYVDEAPEYISTSFLPYDPVSVKIEVEDDRSFSPWPGLGMNMQIKDEMTEEEYELNESSYSEIYPMDEESVDIKPDVVDHGLGPEVETTCFVDVDTLQAAHLSCAEVFSNHSEKEEQESVEESLGNNTRRTKQVKMKCRKTTRQKLKKVDPDWLPWSAVEISKDLISAKVKHEEKKKSNTKRSKQLLWMKQQKQKIEQHILEVRTNQRALEEKRYQVGLEQKWKGVTLKYRPNVNVALISKVSKVKRNTGASQIVQRRPVTRALRNSQLDKPLLYDMENKNDDILKCPICKETFPDAETQTSHTMTCVWIKRYPCSVCGKNFHGPLARVSHVIAHHNSLGHHVCYQCGKLFHHVSELQIHRSITKCVDFVKFPCDVCNKEFLDATSQIQHMTAHSLFKLDTKSFSKIVKGENNTNGKIQRTYAKSSISDSEKCRVIGYLCNVCNKLILTQDALAKHQQVVHSLYICYCCKTKFSFNDERMWLKHMKIYHYPQLPRYPCTKCTRSFFSLVEAVRHEKVHIREESMRAIEAAARSARSQLEKEGSDGPVKEPKVVKQTSFPMKRVGGPYACYVCGKSFDDLSARAVHVFSHIGEKAFTCPTCNKQFTVKANLESHMTIHV